MDEDIKIFKKILIWLIGVSMVVGLVYWAAHKTETVADSAFINYEQFTDLYQTCQKLNTDLGNMRKLPKDDPMFAQFSKEQRINALQTQLNRWIEDYNSKSKQWNRSMWKSKELPYQLSITNFDHYYN